MIREGQTAQYHLSTGILTIDLTPCDDTAIPITIQWCAPGRSALKPLAHDRGCPRPARPDSPIFIPTGLIQFRRIYTVQTHPDAANVPRIRVDDVYWPFQHISGKANSRKSQNKSQTKP